MQSPFLTILRQPCKCQPTRGAFQVNPDFAWFVRAIIGQGYYQGILEGDATLEHLELLGKNTWGVLEQCGQIDGVRLGKLRESLTYPETLGFYPVARLRTGRAPALGLPLPHSAAELASLSEKYLKDLEKNSFKISEYARHQLGSGEVPSATRSGVNFVEFLELELSDRSLLLGWGWVKYFI